MRLEHFIDGRFAWRGEGLSVVEPATGREHASCAIADVATVDEAVRAATRAFPAWRNAGAAERSRHLMKLAELLERDLEAFARAESIDSGKPIALARSVEIPRAIANLRFFAELILSPEEERYELPGRARSTVLRRSRGVAACISPWNLPLYLFTWKIAPALAAGCTVVGKPSELTPVTATMLCRLAQEAGLPAGVLNVVHGRGADTGAALVAHPGISTITFTGGTATGAAIARVAAPRFARLSLELGGKNPSIVFNDAPEAAVEGVVRAAFQNQGQICLCGSRVLVERGILDSFVGRFVARARALRQGDPLDEATEQGALVSGAHCAKVEGAIAEARKAGAEVLLGGARPGGLPDRCAEGYFVQPTVLAGLKATAAVNQEEIFGPVATIIPFEGEEEAIAIANGVRYGLAASVWTGDADRARRVAARLDAGTVWINSWLLRDLRVPFGGWKESGVGREGGREALHFFCEATTVCEPLAGGSV